MFIIWKYVAVVKSQGHSSVTTNASNNRFVRILATLRTEIMLHTFGEKFCQIRLVINETDKYNPLVI